MLIECIILAKWAQIILWWTHNTCPVKTTDHVIDVHYISANITLITFNDSSWPLDIYHMFLDGQPKWHTILYLLHITFHSERHDLLISEYDSKLDVFWTGWLFYYCGMTLVTWHSGSYYLDYNDSLVLMYCFQLLFIVISSILRNWSSLTSVNWILCS